MSRVVFRHWQPRIVKLHNANYYNFEGCLFKDYQKCSILKFEIRCVTGLTLFLLTVDVFDMEGVIERFMFTLRRALGSCDVHEGDVSDILDQIVIDIEQARTDAIAASNLEAAGSESFLRMTDAFLVQLVSRFQLTKVCINDECFYVKGSQLQYCIYILFVGY